MISSSPATDALWLELFQRLCGKVAHELKGALNGVSLNLEVVRSRSLKPDAPASSLATFAGSAASQFDLVMDMTEALLALSRATPAAVDLASTLRWLVALIAPAAKTDGRELRIDGSLASLGTSPVESSAARSAIASALLAAVESVPGAISGSTVVCRANGEVLEITSENATALTPPPDDVVSAVREVGIEFRAAWSAISITFPR